MNSVLRLSLPLTLWLASFSAVYGLHGLLCSDRWNAPVDEGTLRGLLILATVAAILVQILLMLALRSPRWPETDPTLRRISLVLAAVALASTVWTLLPPVAAASSCGEAVRMQPVPFEPPRHWT
ncbi:MAG: hypothetical protein RIA08_11520 [Roseovarius sp.]|uniref:hypothetical protein n=1 Tax=Roseovarius sp. TaxID=1486281 RepID=UPI0032ECB8AA